MLTTAEASALARGPYGGVIPFTDKDMLFVHAVEREAYKRAAAECRVTCGKNHADAATFKSGTKAYVQGCDDCAAAIEALEREE